MGIRRIVVLVAVAWAAVPATVAAQNLPSGFQRSDPITGRNQPSGVYFAHDGRVFVTEKGGKIWVYPNLTSTAPQLFADLGNEVHDYWDRGLLGFALDPRFPERPYVYVQYTYNGGLFPDQDPLPWVPRWPATNCPTPPGATADNGGCVASGRVSRLTVDGAGAGAEQVLVEDWYQQYPSHSIGTILFGPDGYLYAGGGDGASFNWRDYGQRGNPAWPDRRSPLNPAVPTDPATNQGGSLRSQGLEVESQYVGQQVWLNGTIIRIDAADGSHAPGNPLAATGLSENARRIVAYGLRNPFRFTVRPGTGELWVGDVGENTWEEINVIPALPEQGATLRNFGWPCYEGRGRHSGFTGPICSGMYANGDTGGRVRHAPPWYTYVHTGSSDTTGLAFYTGTSYPAAYRNSLFAADNSRTVIFNIPFVDADGDGMPDAPPDGSAAIFYGGALAKAVQLTIGPGGDLFYANLENNRISRIFWCDGCGNQAPSAAIALDAGSLADGPPRTIAFTAANSVDPNAGDALSYDWDLDGDGVFGDAGGATASHAYTADGSYRVAVRVTDAAGASDVQAMLVTVATPQADLGVTLDDGVTTVRRGDALQYTLTVTNHGPDAVAGAQVATTLSAQLDGIAWTCSADAGATCAPAGEGDVADGVDLPPGASVVYVIAATVAADAEGTIESTATVAVPAGYADPDPSNDAAGDVDTVDDTIFRDGFDG